MSSSNESLVEYHLDFTELDLRRADLRDLQLAQASRLREAGVLTEAIFVAARRGNDPPDQSAYWACVYKDPFSGRGGIRFTAYYADAAGELPLQAFDVPVYETFNGCTLPLKPFEDGEADIVAQMIADLEFEQQYGMFPDLTPDLTALSEPTAG